MTENEQRLGAREQVELRKQSLRGSIDNFTRVLKSAEQAAAQYRDWIKEAKAELLMLHEDEEEIILLIEEVEGPLPSSDLRP